MNSAAEFLSARAPLFMLAGVVAGFLLPGVAEFMRPLVVPISVVMVVVSILRIDPSRLAATFRRPALLAAAGAFVLIALPVVTYLAASLLGAPGWLVTGLTYTAAAPPLSSAAAFAILMRVDAALVTGISLPAILAAPVTVWAITAVLPGLGQGVELGALITRLLFIILGALVVALIVRRSAGKARVESWGPLLDAATVILVMAIGLGVMHDIGIAARAGPLNWLGILGLTALISYASLFFAIAVFWPAGRDEACAVGLCASIKNMALMVAAVLGTVDPRISLVVITAQFPIFLSPILMRPLFARLTRPERPA